MEGGGSGPTSASGRTSKLVRLIGESTVNARARKVQRVLIRDQHIALAADHLAKALLLSDECDRMRTLSLIVSRGTIQS